ncbi:MAG: hypothetical protein O6952_03110 [Planctomycetota bacterium]|nr:hypothetical protein [Planctomycetota bacterium]
MPRPQGRKKLHRVDGSLREGWFEISALSCLASLWFLYRVMAIRSWMPLALGSLALALGLTLLIGGTVIVLRQRQVRPAFVAATINVLAGLILIAIPLLGKHHARPGWSYEDLFPFGLFLVLFGIMILIIGRMRRLERMPL